MTNDHSLLKPKNTHSRFYCASCGRSRLVHVETWLAETKRFFIPRIVQPRRFRAFLSRAQEIFFRVTKLGCYTSDFAAGDVLMRSWVYAQALRARGAQVFVLKTVKGYTTHFKVRYQDQAAYFNKLPNAGFISRYHHALTEDKQAAKQHFIKGNFPVAPGTTFYFWQKKQALTFAKEIGFPVVVKPRGGSVSRHVTTDIRTEEQLVPAMKYACEYSPAFIIERFIEHAFVHRATVIDFSFVACVQQVPANVVGDGVLTIRQLIDSKNKDPRRGYPQQKQFTLNKLVVNETTQQLLQRKRYAMTTVLKAGERFYLQKDPFLKLGGDLVEVTSKVHPDNLALFKAIARFFDIRLTGIDFLVNDIAVSWKKQPCAVLELNSFPCIELHHYPSEGAPSNPAAALVDMFFKYYVSPKK